MIGGGSLNQRGARKKSPTGVHRKKKRNQGTENMVFQEIGEHQTRDKQNERAWSKGLKKGTGELRRKRDNRNPSQS